MAYFNHAFKKCFVATHSTQPSDPGVCAGVTDGILTDAGVPIYELKNINAPYQLGPGVVGMFDAKTNLSLDDRGVDCCPFYIAAASLRTYDKIGPFHGGYQEANKSKIINPKYIRKVYKVGWNSGSQAILEIGGTLANGNVGAVLTAEDTVSGGTNTGYTTAVGAATTGGTGTGLTVNFTATAGVIDAASIVINNPGFGYTATDVITIDGGNGATFLVLTVDEVNECTKKFMCGQTYYLRIDIKGTPSLRFAQHNLYRTLDAFGGCCVDPENPAAVDPSMIYLQWATQISEDPILNQYVQAFLVVDGQSYAYNAEQADAAGLDPTLYLYSMAPTTSTSAGIVLMGAYAETKFGTCTFYPTDYYHVEPIQLYASEVDYTGNPCTFESLCIVRRCEGIQGNGLGEQKIREVILSESYLQNFFHKGQDLRIREITGGTDIFNVLNPDWMYSSFFVLHSVPRYNNPTGTFDNDQYLLEIIGSDGTIAVLDGLFTTLLSISTCTDCVDIEDFTAVAECDFVLPQIQ